MMQRSLLTALALTLGSAAAQTETPTPSTPETVAKTELTGLDHLLRLLESGAEVMVLIDGEYHAVAADGTIDGDMGNIKDMTGDVTLKIGETTYVLAGSLAAPGMPKVTVDLANGKAQTIALPAALNRKAHGLNRALPAPAPELPVIDEPVIKPELPTPTLERRPADLPSSKGRGR